MPRFDECCVLIPSSTLEDFPVKASDSDACSMLAAWTVLWHPRLLAESGQIPTWYRADSPPEPTIPRVITVPDSSVELLPERYESRAMAVEGTQWITGKSRDEMLAGFDLDDPLQELVGKHREIGVADFFAAGFTLLQIQVMTRRLRYTSNLDEIHLQSRAVTAAKAFVDGDADAAIDALHDFFDCLAEERDHYFSSDPHLIDLTLLTPSTLESLLDSGELVAPAATRDASNSLLMTPRNILVDSDTARHIGNHRDQFQPIRKAITEGYLGWAGGGPDSDVSFDSMTYGQAEQALVRAADQTADAIGSRAKVFACYAGTTPADLTDVLAKIGYAGIVPIDFASGTGFGDEAKVIQDFGGAQIESLTAKPIDAASDAAFLDLGSRLGEAIDSGEIATGLLAHWPGRVCQSFEDLRRAASWTLALGRFWKLDDYFCDGERPYHHGKAKAATSDSAQRLADAVSRGDTDPISSVADSFREAITKQTGETLHAMTALVRGKALVRGSALVRETADGESERLAAEEFATASGAEIRQVNGGEPPSAVMLVNPQDVAIRQAVEIAGPPPSAGEHIFSATPMGSAAMVTVDTPAMGFATTAAGDAKSSQGSLLRKWFGKPKLIADDESLQNEFMEVAISPKTGGIQGVYSGGARGNRFSLRLVVERHDPTDVRSGDVRLEKADDEKGAATPDKGVMVCRELRITESTPDIGRIATSGTIDDATGKTLAAFDTTYTLRRGGRMLEVSGSIRDVVQLGNNPWRDYVALRAAVSSEAAIHRILLRDKVHRGAGRRMVAPLGVVIDEAERQTLIASGGLAFHRRVGERYLDTLLLVKGESRTGFSVQYGFDVSSPLAVSKSVIAPAAKISIAKAKNLSPRGWIIHSAPKDTMIGDVQVATRSDGRLAALVRVIQTRSKPTTATLRFCRDVAFARKLTTDLKIVDWEIDAPEESSSEDDEVDPSVREDAGEPDVKGELEVNGESVRLAMAGHQVADVLVVFAGKS